MSSPLLKVDSLRYSYPQGGDALRGISFSLRPGEKVALVGANGAGKTTLLLHTNGLLLPALGRVEVCGLPVEKKTLKEVRRKVGFVFQNAEDQLFMPSVREDLAFGLRNMNLPEEEVARRVEITLAQLDIAHLGERMSHTLSAGERSLAALAAVLCMEPVLLAMDEPTAGLDPRARRRLMELLPALPSGMLIATHDLDLVWELRLRVLVLDRGRLVADGSACEVLADAALMDASGLEPPCAVRLSLSDSSLAPRP
ncbi:MAG: energy-coupling factor ABC transporter ATP-binding protein [Akkermansiaceae bacterium]|nr:energy-coupling factor ABC transporter ATP-binding protein [Akkermansiaceae bacterium]